MEDRLAVGRIRTNPLLLGKVLALVSPVLAAGVVRLILLASGYSYMSIEERANPEGERVEVSSESGWVSAYAYALENGDFIYFF